MVVACRLISCAGNCICQVFYFGAGVTIGATLYVCVFVFFVFGVYFVLFEVKNAV